MIKRCALTKSTVVTFGNETVLVEKIKDTPTLILRAFPPFNSLKELEDRRSNPQDTETVYLEIKDLNSLELIQARLNTIRDILIYGDL